MNAFRRSGTTCDRRIAAYLRRLDRELADTDPDGRAEVLHAVAEHIDARVEALGHEPSDAEMTAILDDLGSPGTVVGRDGRVTGAGRWRPVLVLAFTVAGFAGLAASGPPLVALSAMFLLVAAVSLIGSSAAWRIVESVVAALALLVGAGASFFLAALTTETMCSGGDACAVGSVAFGSAVARAALVTTDVAFILAAGATIVLVTRRGWRRAPC